jgi:hypothetical protein
VPDPGLLIGDVPIVEEAIDQGGAPRAHHLLVPGIGQQSLVR